MRKSLWFRWGHGRRSSACTEASAIRGILRVSPDQVDHEFVTEHAIRHGVLESWPASARAIGNASLPNGRFWIVEALARASIHANDSHSSVA